MTLRAWRIVQARWAATAFSGEGARLYGGRWNTAGRAAVYVAEHPALAAMEMLVHLEAEQLLASAYVLIEVTFDDALVDVVSVDDLPRGWAADPAPVVAQEFGDAWLAAPTSRPLLRLPSAVVRGGWNYLLNPRHPQFAELQIGEPRPFEFDARLLKK